jgi:TRAP-type C4-dicarboxylate transport system permease small subunit
MVIYALIIVLSFVAVFFRYVLNNSISWAEELTRYLFIALVYLGAAYVIPKNGHLRLDVFYRSLPAKYRKALDLCMGFCAALFLILVLQGTKASIPIFGRQRWSTLPFSMAWAYAAIPIGVILSLVYLADMFIKWIRNLRNSDQKPSSETSQD